VSHGNDKGTAAVTGAAGGLGACFARNLAAQGYALWLTDRQAEQLELTDRQAEQLESLRREIVAAHGVRVEICAADLSDARALDSLSRQLSQISDVELLINNAGFATVGHFVEIDAEVQLDMIRVHVMTPTRLTRAVLPGMVERNRGAIVNVSSLGAWLPAAGSVEYASTKAYLVMFSQALREELRGTNVRVQALCPGFVQTGFHDSQTMTGFDKDAVPPGLWNTAEQVVEYSLKSLARNRSIAIPGWKNRLLNCCMRALVLRPIAHPLMRALGGDCVKK
jgi:short-subunit dehydrogenase